MLLVYYRLYITYTLDGFLFNLDQSNVCRDIQKGEPLIRKCLIVPQKIYKITKRSKTPGKLNNIFQVFYLSYIVQNSRYFSLKNKERRRKIYYSGKKKKHTLKNQLMMNNRGYILHKAAHKKGKTLLYLEYTRITIL